MRRKLLTTVAILCANSYLVAGTISIGSVASQGELQVDNYPINVTGTVFEGSQIETGSSAQSDAEVRLANGVKLTLYRDSRGTLYRDHFVLQRGAVDVAGSSAFHTEISGLVITPSASHGRGLISLGSEGAVDVLTRAGDLEVTRNGGEVLALVHSQKSLAFARSDDGSWRTGNTSPDDFRDSHHHCYVDGDGDNDRDDRDCGGHHHHHHPSR